MTPAETVMLVDGGLSTALERRGHRADGPLWTGELLLSNPDAVVLAHRDFVAAGAEIIITGSYQISFDGGTRVGWSLDETTQALRNSTTAARMAADEGTLVAASVGPYGAALADGSEYRGNYGVTRAALRDFHAKRLDVIVETEPDLLAIETQPDLGEIDVILELLDERAPELPFWVACTVDTVGRIAGGATWSEVVARVAASDAALAVGINCSTPDVIAETVNAVDSAIPYVIYPNHGMTWHAESNAWTGRPAEVGAAEIGEWVRAGARIVGGCCGYDADSIAELRRVLQDS